MTAELVACLKCKTVLPPQALNTDGFTRCPACGAETYAAVFPALFRETRGNGAGDPLPTDGDAGCFHHPHKKAATICERCGAFLCGLCAVDFDGTHLCSACIEAGEKRLQLEGRGGHWVRYDQIALSLSFFPLLIFPVTLLTAPIALFIAIRHGKRPKGLVAATKSSRGTAIVLASLQIVGWTLFFYNLLQA